MKLDLTLFSGSKFSSFTAFFVILSKVKEVDRIKRILTKNIWSIVLNKAIP